MVFCKKHYFYLLILKKSTKIGKFLWQGIYLIELAKNIGSWQIFMARPSASFSHNKQGNM